MPPLTNPKSFEEEIASLRAKLLCSPVNPITNVLPLVLVLAVSLAKEAFEDRKRAVKDREVR